MSKEQPQINPTYLHCVKCNYDVSGTPVGSVCPECGKSVYESIREAQIYEQPNYTAANCLILGTSSLFTFGITSPIAIWLYFNAKREMKNGNFSKSEHMQANVGLILGIISIPLSIFIFTF